MYIEKLRELAASALKDIGDMVSSAAGTIILFKEGLDDDDDFDSLPSVDTYSEIRGSYSGRITELYVKDGIIIVLCNDADSGEEMFVVAGLSTIEILNLCDYLINIALNENKTTCL